MGTSFYEANNHLADISQHYNKLQSILSVNNLTLKRVYPDGNCLFSSTIELVKEANPNLTVQKLRQIVSDHMLEYAVEYSPFMSVKCKESYKDTVIQIAQPGTWSSDISDAIPLAISNLFQERMIIYSSREEQAYITVEPTLALSQSVNVNRTPFLQYAYLAVTNCEHYDPVIIPTSVKLNLAIPKLQLEAHGSEWLEEVDDAELLMHVNQHEILQDMEPESQHDMLDDELMAHMETVEMNNQQASGKNLEETVKKAADDNCPEDEGRKRKKSCNVDPNLWQKNIRKNKRQRGDEYAKSDGSVVKKREVKPSSCGGCRFKCDDNILADTRQALLQDFWQLSSIDRQRDFICSNVEEEHVVSRKQNTAPRKQTSRKYSLPFKGRKERVCKSFFCKTLDISQAMIHTALMKRTQSNTSLPDLRGKRPPTNKTPSAQVSWVKQHIESFPVVDSHYCRKDTSKGYLDNNLSLRVMYNLYKEKAFLEK